MRRRLALCLLLLPTLSAAQTIEVEPSDALADVPIRIALRGFAPNTPVVLRAFAEDAANASWQSSARFITDPNGSYSAVDAVGLITSMEVAGEKKRFETRGLSQFKIRVTAQVDEKDVASTEITRRFIADGVKSVRRIGRVLFTPPTAPIGRVLMIGGSEGGFGSPQVASVLASHGFVVLSVAYFGLPDLPQELREIPLETFDAAIDYLLQQPASRPGVAIVGTSRGAEAALLVARDRSDISAVVAYVPSSVVWSCICSEPGKPSWTRKGQPVPFVAPGRDPRHASPSGFPSEPAVHFEWRLRSAAPETRIAVERINAPLMLIAGERDRMWPSATMSRDIMKSRGGRSGDRLIIAPGAGHLIGKLILPSGSTLTGNGRIETGGSSEANARAQAATWPAVLNFLER